MNDIWESMPVVIIRWLLFLPVSIILLKLIEVAIVFFIIWLYRDIRGFLIIALFGGAIYLFISAYLFYLSSIKITYICPSVEIGSIAIGTVYFIMQIFIIVMHIINHNDIGESALFVSSALLTMAVYVAAAYEVRFLNSVK